MRERTLNELDLDDGTRWAEVSAQVADGRNDGTVLPASAASRMSVLTWAQVTTRSTLGSIVRNCGGVLFDHGWIRLLGGADTESHRSIASWNEAATGMTTAGAAGYLLVADDVVGGFFAIDGGGLGKTPGNVCYLSQDTLAWEDLGLGYTEFVRWLCDGDLTEFYAAYRGPDWRDRVASFDQAFTIYPFPWAKEGGELWQRSWGAVPVLESWSLLQ